MHVLLYDVYQMIQLGREILIYQFKSILSLMLEETGSQRINITTNYLFSMSMWRAPLEGPQVSHSNATH